LSTFAFVFKEKAKVGEEEKKGGPYFYKVKVDKLLFYLRDGRKE